MATKRQYNNMNGRGVRKNFFVDPNLAHWLAYESKRSGQTQGLLLDQAIRLLYQQRNTQALTPKGDSSHG